MRQPDILPGTGLASTGAVGMMRRERTANRYARRAREEHGDTGHRARRMNLVNPRFVLRNYLAQQAIEAAEQADDLRPLHRLLDAARQPYSPDCPADLVAMRPEWARNKAGASMLSCSSWQAFGRASIQANAGPVFHS